MAHESNQFRAVILTGDGLRHQFFVQCLKSYFRVELVVTQAKKIGNRLSSNAMPVEKEIRAHFEKNRATEEAYIGPLLESTQRGIGQIFEAVDINAEKLLAKVRDIKPDVILVFGTKVLNEGWLDLGPPIVNLHLGWSPHYRGSATLFWPFFFNELHLVGSTVHLIDRGIDTGPILDIVPAEFEVGLNYYQVTIRHIMASIKRYPVVVKDFLDGEIVPVPQQKNDDDRICKTSHFDVSSLRIGVGRISEGLTARAIENIYRKRKCPS